MYPLERDFGNTNVILYKTCFADNVLTVNLVKSCVYRIDCVGKREHFRSAIRTKLGLNSSGISEYRGSTV